MRPLSITFATFGRCSLISMPLAAVLIGLNSPAPLLSGCIAVAATAGAVAGVQTLRQERPVGAALDDRAIKTTLDVIGGSSHHWHWKHNVFHHTYVNITGQDTDIDLGGLGRLTPHGRQRWVYRWQQFYMWPLYGFMAINWHLVGDFRDVIPGRIGEHRMPRPKRWDLAVFIAGKVIFFMVAFGIPLLFHPVWVVVVFYAAATIVLGLVLSVVFELAHCVEHAEFPLPAPDTG